MTISNLTARESLIRDVEADHTDSAAVAALADLLAEAGDEAASLGLRWAVNRRIWPMLCQDYLPLEDPAYHLWGYQTRKVVDAVIGYRAKLNNLYYSPYPSWLDALRALGAALLAARKETYP